MDYSINQVMNGTVWLNESTCSRVVVQWVDKDEYVILCEPYRAYHGGTAMMVLSSGGFMKTREDTFQFLKSKGFRPEPSLCIGMVENERTAPPESKSLGQVIDQFVERLTI